MNCRQRISDPDALLDAERRIRLAFGLWHDKRLPVQMDGFMIACPLKRALRAIYGKSDANVAWMTIFESIRSWIKWKLNPIFRFAFYTPNYAIAWVWTKCWGYWNVARGIPGAFCWGRRESPEPIHCSTCHWSGPRRWAHHSYQDDGSGQDVEPLDECPCCYAEI